MSAVFIFFFLEGILATSISTSFPSCVSILAVADCFFFLLENFRNAGTVNKEEMHTHHARNFFLDTFLFSINLLLVNQMTDRDFLITIIVSYG
jgi:hypothetical protein